MARCPFAEWRGPLPGSNFGPGPAPKIGVAHHVIVGTLSSADSEFRGQGVQLSAHFGLADGTDFYPDGHLVQWLDTDDNAYAQAAGNFPPTAYIAVETAGQPTTPWTPAQIAMLGRLDAWAAGVHGFPLALVNHGSPGLTTHCFYPSGAADPAWGNHSCPGAVRLGQMPLVLAAAQGDVSNVPAPTDWIKHIPTSDGYWHLRADGALARSPGSGWRAHAMLRNDGHIYAFPYTENGVVYQDYADLPAADRVAPPGAWITDCWLV